jgi:hypothetical protein
LIRNIGRYPLAWLVALLFHCSNSVTTGNGGSSQTVNARMIVVDTTVSVIVDDSITGTLSLHAYSAGYQPYEQIGYADSTESDVATVVNWKAPVPNSYSFLLSVQPSGNACFLKDIALVKGTRDTIGCKLGPCYDIIGSVEPDDSGAVPAANQYELSIAGSPFYSITDSMQGFIMPGVPSGAYTIRVRPMLKRLFVSTAEYSIVADSLGNNKRVRLVLP